MEENGSIEKNLDKPVRVTFNPWNSLIRLTSSQVIAKLIDSKVVLFLSIKLPASEILVPRFSQLSLSSDRR